MKLVFFMIVLTILTSCKTDSKSNKKSTSEENSTTAFFVGTYTDGDSEGIYKYTLEKDGTLKKVGLATTSENPSFLTKSADGNYLIAINEISNKDSVGTVESYKIDDDKLTLISKSSSGGAHPCFVTTNNKNYVLTANYTGGNMGLLKLNSKGELSDLIDLQQHYGKGTTDRQDAPHAHSAWFAPEDNEIISVDLGTNELWFSKLDTTIQKILPLGQNKLKMADGAGPRHLTFHPNGEWIYVLNELNGTITLIHKNAEGIYEKGTIISTLPKDFKGPNTCADIHITWAGKFVYASNRGHNSIGIFKVNDLDGSLTLIGHESTRGDGPRNFSLSPDENYLLVANQLTNNIVSFKRDRTTGLLEFIDEIEAPTPVCILF